MLLSNLKLTVFSFSYIFLKRKSVFLNLKYNWGKPTNKKITKYNEFAKVQNKTSWWVLKIFTQKKYRGVYALCNYTQKFFHGIEHLFLLLQLLAFVMERFLNFRNILTSICYGTEGSFAKRNGVAEQRYRGRPMFTGSTD